MSGLNALAQWVGYVVIVSGGALFTVVIVTLAAWQIIDWWYRRYVNFKLLREFMRWQRNGWNPFEDEKQTETQP